MCDLSRDIGLISRGKKTSEDWSWMSIEDGLRSFVWRFDLLFLWDTAIVLLWNGAAFLGIVGRHGDCEEIKWVRRMRTRVCGKGCCAHVSVGR